MEVTEEHKKQIERKIAEVMITALEDGKVGEADLPTIATFVLEKIDKAQNHDELIKSLDELSAKWPVFENLEQIERGEVSEASEDTVEKGVLKLAKSGQVEEAINLAKTVTEN